MSRETLKNFLNLKGFGTDSVSPGFDKEGKASREEQFDLGEDLNTGEPLLNLSDEATGLLGDYLSYITENAQNVFGINPGNEEAAASNRGDSLAIAEEQGAADVFLTQGTEAANTFNQNSNSQYFDGAGSPVASIIDKTSNSSDSHNLLSSIEGRRLSKEGQTLTDTAGENNNVTKAVNSVLLNNNRFANVTSKTAFATKGSNLQDFESSDDAGTHTSQRSFGEFNMEGSRVSLDQLKDVGLSLLYKASGYDNGEQPGDSFGISDLKDQILSGEANSSLIGGNGYNKLTSKNMRPKYAKGAPEDTAGNSTRSDRGEFFGDDPDAGSSKSFGTSYNHTVQFSGKGRKILKLKASIACLALKKISKDFIDQISEFIKFKDLKSLQETSDTYSSLDKSYSGPGPYPLGSYKQLNSFELDIFKKLILVRTDYPYPICYEKGVEVFFGESDDIKDMKNHDHIQQAPGYWLSVASTMLKSFDQMSAIFQDMESFESESVDKISTLIEIVKSNKLIQFANAAATVGDVFLKTNGGLLEKSKSSHKPYDVDSMPGGPAARVGKSRDNGPYAESPLSLSWRQSSVPSMYLLPRNLVKAAVDLNNIADGVSPARGMLTSILVKNTYLDRQHGGSFNRIPNDVVKRMENKLEAEYVPFYIQDLRTNELISFHAFLTNLTDNIKADYSQVTGYGRLDPVQTYKTTTRTVGVTFVLYATSKEDFNAMWYKINKLTTLLYPQWTQGTQLSTTGTDRFIQPFSQVLGASPIVRLRVGDVIKSNYSRFNLARMFGIGDENINPVLGTTTNALEQAAKKVKGSVNDTKNTFADIMLEIFYGVMGTPLQYIPSSGKTRNKTHGLTIGRNFLSNLLINGFVNPLGAGLVLRNLIDPNSSNNIDAFGGHTGMNVASAGEGLARLTLSGGINGDLLGYHAPQRVFIKANMNKGYRHEDGTVVRFDRPLRALVLKKLSSDKETISNSNNPYVSSPNFKKGNTHDHVRNRTRYLLKVIDPAAPAEMFFSNLEVDHQYVMPDPKDLFMTTSGLLLGIAQPLSFVDYVAEYVGDAAQALGVGSETIQLVKDLYATEPEKFMQPENNPFTRALESTAGRGLAGVMDGFNFNWLNNDYTWETDYNSRAPRGVEISFNLSVIHDLPPGLDHSGYNRAPLYNVGDVMKDVAGDARGDDAGAEFEYRRNGANTFSKTGK